MRSIVKESLFIVLSSASVAFAQTPIQLTVSGNQVQGRFELPGGISGDLTITFDPSASSALSFEGEYTTSLHTLNLELDGAVPMSLLKSPDGGLFQDVTKLKDIGSKNGRKETSSVSSRLMLPPGSPW